MEPVRSPNQKLCKLFAVGMEVGQAYTSTIEAILAHPELRNYKYILTLEHDNVPPPDGLVRLLECAENNPQYAAIGDFTSPRGLAASRRSGKSVRASAQFQTTTPTSDDLVPCNGTGMGFTLFRLDMFKDEKLRRPWFKTSSSQDQGVFTQDLYFWTDANKHGYKCAIDTRIKVGHYCKLTDQTW